MTNFVATSDFEQFMAKVSYPCAVLHVYVNPENEHLFSVYKEHIHNHNKKIVGNAYPDSGFDVFFPSETVFQANQQHDSKFVGLDIKAKMDYYSDKNAFRSCAYTVEPRSSISKTALMLANGRGIIDAGYRGWIIAAMRSLTQGEYRVDKHTRLLQILHPTLCPIIVRLVTDEQELSVDATSRGAGGFGSTGSIGANNS
jgi:dUTPase